MAATSKSRTTAAKPSANTPIDPAVVRELAHILSDTGLTEIEVERGDLRVRVARETSPQIVQSLAPSVAAPPPSAAPTVAPPETPARTDAADPIAHPGAVPSPMVGTVYLASDPKTPPFVKAGDTVKEGQTLLLIEAMKTFNPIPAPRAGVVKEVTVQDGEPVEFGQALVILS